MSDDDDNSNEDEMSNEEMLDVQEISGQHDNTGSGKTRASIKLKLFRKAPQTDESGIKAITKRMTDHSLDANDNFAEAIYDSDRGRPLEKQSPELQRSGTEKDRLARRGRGRKTMRSEPDNHHRIGGTRSTFDGRQAQTASDEDPSLDPNGRDDTKNSDSDNSPVIKLDDSDDDMHDNKNIELLGYARARRQSIEVEAEDYDDWEGFVDGDEGNCYGGYEDDEGDEEEVDADGEEEDDQEDEDDEESEEAKLNNKYGWSQPQSDRIRFPPPPQLFFNMPSQPSSLSLEEPAGAHVTEDIENGVSEEQINEGLAEELRRTRLDETLPGAQQ